MGEPIALEMSKGEPIPLNHTLVDEEELRTYLENNAKQAPSDFEGR